MNPTPTLIADDSAMIIKIVKKALLANIQSDLRFDESCLYTASDGMEAFEIIAKHPEIKLIISDINMPHLNGNEFIEILQDTSKIDNIDVIFITSSKTNIMHNSALKNKILGVVYKPFNVKTFNEKMEKLYVDNKNLLEYRVTLQKKQVEQKKTIQKISTSYLEKYSINYNQELLDAQIDDNFDDEEIQENEYDEIVHATLSLYMFVIEEEHTVDIKQVKCIMNTDKPKEVFEKNRFALISGFETTMKEIEGQELSNKELLGALVNPIIEKIAFALASAKRFPRQPIKRFSTNFNYITKELEKIDCEFINTKLIKLLLALDEMNNFHLWIKKFLEKNEICLMIPAIKQNSPMHNEITKRFKNINLKNNIVREHYCGEIDSYIWKRAKNSQELKKYFQVSMPNKMLNSLEFLYLRQKYTFDEYKKNYPLDKKNIIVISSSLETLEFFKSLTTHSPLDNWVFHAFAKQTMLEAWLNSNTPQKLIVDFSFNTPDIENGLDLLTLIAQANPIIDKLVKTDQLFLIAKNNDLIKIRERKQKIKFTILDSKLNTSSITKTLIYN